MKLRIKKKIITVTTLGVMLLIPFACKKSFLQQTNYTQLTGDAYFNKASDGIALVNSIYDTYQNADLLKKSIWYYANFQSHDFFNWGNDRFYNYYNIPTTFDPIRTFWKRAYVGIARANTALQVIPDMLNRGVLTQDLANRLLGESYFLRGMTYYYLGGSFGGVPLELATNSNGLSPRASQDSVFKQVAADMAQAASLLPWKEDMAAEDLGRATKGAAIAYGGAAKMWYQDYAGALADFNQLEGKYALMTNFVDVNEYDKQNNTESIFEVQFAVNGTQSWGAGNEVAWISDFSWPEEVSNFGYDYGNPGLYLSYQAGDTRKIATIIGPGDSSVSPGIIAKGGIKSYPLVVSGFSSSPKNPKYVGDDGNIINSCGTKSNPWYGSDGDGLRTGFYCAKMWRDPTLTGNSGAGIIFGAQNQILLRYAEVLLDKAECQARTGDKDGARATLKRVRDRAWGGTAPATMQDGAKYDGTAAPEITDELQMVLSEYRHELSGEYSVFFDLRRAGAQVAVDFIKNAYGTVDNNTDIIVNPAKILTDQDPDNGTKKHGLYNTSMTIDKELYPIPEAERGLNPNLLQNNGY